MVGTFTHLGHQAPQIYKQCLCSILITGLVTNLDNWKQLHPHLLHSLSPTCSNVLVPNQSRTTARNVDAMCTFCWASSVAGRADGWWADTPPKPWACISQQSWMTWDSAALTALTQGRKESPAFQVITLDEEMFHTWSCCTDFRSPAPSGDSKILLAIPLLPHFQSIFLVTFLD